MPDAPRSGPGPAPAEVDDTYAKSRERLGAARSAPASA